MSAQVYPEQPNAMPGFWPELVTPDPTLVEQGTEHLLFVSNPKSRRHAHASEYYDMVQGAATSLGMAVDRQETQRDIEDNIATIQNNAGAKSALVICAGDGGISHMVNALAKSGLDIPVLTAGLGNANDLSHRLLDWRTYRRPDLALQRGVVRDFYPLSVRLESADGDQKEFLALAYVSLGITALAGSMYNSQEYKNDPVHQRLGGTFVKEKQVAADAFFHSDPFQLKTQRSHNNLIDPDVLVLPGVPEHADFTGRGRRRLEFLVANIPRMAKVFRPSVRTFEPEAQIVQVRNRAGGVAKLGALVSHIPVGTPLPEQQSLHFSAQGDVIYLQRDGEDEIFKHGVTGTVGIADPISVVTTRRTA